MQRPISHLVAETVQRSPSRFAASAIAVGALHLALIYALMTGLAVVIVKYIPPDIAVFFIPPERTIASVAAQRGVAEVDAAGISDCGQTGGENRQFARRSGHRGGDQQPAAARARQTGCTRGHIRRLLDGHTYHATSSAAFASAGRRRCVGLRILIAADGHISDVEVSKSSGLQRLDDAAKQWVLAHWLYRAATNNGKPIASQTEALVIFNLKNAW